jgi:hypothetical protein
MPVKRVESVLFMLCLPGVRMILLYGSLRPCQESFVAD